ncbi:IS66 family transposase [Bradyrhizobium sp. CCGB01]|uniref:IS66 family transposase n=1 Tax=Bradyrhizobium sp. CCGB01 TaxID=2949634 RepID=UPI0020B25287|nr:IS66 family transposase [Bradyrhizobium sp. CCGB01]MCP3411288.1 IS66 family transposase [Bradyrhizobium sp. CCGB01]
MQLDLNNLPCDPELLQRLVCDIAAAIDHRDTEIERLKSIIKQLQRMQFGRSSERIDPDQFALGLEDIDSDIARVQEGQPAVISEAPTAQARRRALPDHLPREDVRLDVESEVCNCCGGTLHLVGESVSEMLDWVPAQLRVVRTTRPKYACRACDRVMQAPAPERVIAGGLATPALLAHVLISKYCDHLPLYRQSQILARHSVDLCRSTLAGWVGGACWWLEALHERLCKNVFASDHLFADDTPIPVLDPGRGRTKTARLWVYARDQRPWGGPEPPAAIYLFAPDRRAERPVAHLADFRGILDVDGYAGFEQLADKEGITLAACWSHSRRKFYDVAEATGSPVATHALRRIGELYAIEARIRGRSPADRLAERRTFSKPIADALNVWLDAQLRLVSGRSTLAEAIRYALSRWHGLTRFLHDGRVELDTNPVERAIRPVALGRKNHLFAGSDGGGQRWAVVCSLIATCKLNDVEPYAYLRDVLQRMIDGHPVNRLDELLPWSWKPADHVKT